jgi:hypothetical protein
MTLQNMLELICATLLPPPVPHATYLVLTTSLLVMLYLLYSAHEYWLPVTQVYYCTSLMRILIASVFLEYTREYE